MRLPDRGWRGLNFGKKFLFCSMLFDIVQRNVRGAEFGANVEALPSLARPPAFHLHLQGAERVPGWTIRAAPR